MKAQKSLKSLPALGSFARFVVFGGGVGVLSSLAVPLLAGLMPWTLANALITVASTLLCTELHARFTFRTGRRAGWRRHWQSAGSAAAAYAATCVAMFALHAVQSSPGLLTEQLVYLSASGLAGIGRFVILRLFVFATGRAGQQTTTVPTMQAPTAAVASPTHLTAPAVLIAPAAPMTPATPFGPAPLNALAAMTSPAALIAPAASITPATPAAPSIPVTAQAPAVPGRAGHTGRTTVTRPQRTPDRSGRTGRRPVTTAAPVLAAVGG